MQNKILFIAILWVLMLTTASCVSVKNPPGETSAGPLSDLAWLAGKWTAEQDGMKMEEYWTEPGGAVMVGLHRDVFPDGKVFFEFLILEARENGMVYLAQPMGRPPTEFRLTERGPAAAVFENPAHDFPRRIAYRLEGGLLCAEVSGLSNGVEMKEEWCWQRTDHRR